MTQYTPKVGLWADHISGQLDPREVVEVSEDGTQIRIDILGTNSPWLPAENYDYEAL